MSTASQVESFCESCGTRYAFEPRRSPKRHLVKVGRLVGILPDEPEIDDSALVVSRDPFHGAFHFCLECRRFTCPTCWDAAAGFCRSCAATLSGTDGVSEPVYTLDADTQALLAAAYEDLVRMGTHAAWLQLEAPPEARPAVVAAPLDLGEAPADDLAPIISAGVAAMELRTLQLAREAAESEERDQARLAAELAERAEAERVAAEQAEAQRVAWEQYEIQRQQYEADLAAWETAEAQRVAAEEAEVQRLAAEADAASAAVEAEAMRLAAEAEAQRVASDEPQRVAVEDEQRMAAQRAEADRLAVAAIAARQAAEHAEAQRTAAQRAEAERLAIEAEHLAAQRAEAERLAVEAEAARATVAAEAARLAAESPDETVWEALAGALGPDVAAEEPLAPPTPERPQLPPVPQVPPPPAPSGAWRMGTPPAGIPGWAPPPPAGFRPPAPGWNGGYAAGPAGHPGNGQLRTGIRPCPRCELALSANARFCRRCGLPQG